MKIFNYSNNELNKIEKLYKAFGIDIAKILSSKEGQKKYVNCKCEVVINKVDRDELLSQATDISKELYKLGIDKTLIITFR